MENKKRIAVCQMTATGDREKNMKAVTDLIEKATKNNVQVMNLKFSYLDQRIFHFIKIEINHNVNFFIRIFHRCSFSLKPVIFYAIIKMICSITLNR